ncbi:MAG TPA: hypothetical protein VHN11_21720 [Xanthobacteraceae bacterium]|jgi:hypothetical protein|nr:hypothetical protein [Xanthobacteraceae bacterium]
MQPDLRRIVAVEAHRRRSGRYPVRIHSLGTGETFEIRPAAGGFLDVASGLSVRIEGSRVLLPDGRGPVALTLVGDVGFDGLDEATGEPFSGRAGGGASVTIYDRDRSDYFQYAVGTEADRI